MRHSLLILLVACGQKTQETTPPPAPSQTTALVFMSDFRENYQVNAVDVLTHENGTVLPAKAFETNDVMLRAFDKKLYVIARDGLGDKNSVTVLALEDGYPPSCAAGGACQHKLGVGFNAYDFWAVSAEKAYLTSQPYSPDAPPYQLRNSLTVMNPETGAFLKHIDVEAGAKALGVNLAEEDEDGSFGLASVYADANHLFVGIQMLGGYDVTPRADACGAVSSRVAVIDLATDAVTAVISLKGSNVNGRFLKEAGTDNILVSTTGSQATVGIEPCNGVERINTKTLKLGTPFATEASLGGTVMAFAVGADGRGIAFLFTGGDFNNPTYLVTSFDTNGAIGEPIFAPANDALKQPGFVVANDRGEAYVSLPYEKNAKFEIVNLSTGEKIDSITLSNHPIDVALVPGIPYIR